MGVEKDTKEPSCFNYSIEQKVKHKNGEWIDRGTDEKAIVDAKPKNNLTKKWSYKEKDSFYMGAHFMNDPNYENEGENKSGNVEITPLLQCYAIRNIKAGEEITFNYNKKNKKRKRKNSSPMTKQGNDRSDEDEGKSKKI